MSDSTEATFLYPSLSATQLKQAFVGKRLQDIDNLPAAVVDAAVVRKNCTEMLEIADALGVGFRAHVKTHKTTEVTRLQVGENTTSVNIVASTLSEIEHLQPYLLDCQTQGKKINVLYGVPPGPSAIKRLKNLRYMLGTDSISLMIDCPDQLRMLSELTSDAASDAVPIFIKIDTGSHRAGIGSESTTLEDLFALIAKNAKGEDKSILKVKIMGFYSHLGSSYGVSSSLEALEYLTREIEGAAKAADHVTKLVGSRSRWTISVGATPTSLSAKNLLLDSPESAKTKGMVKRIQESYDIELHAGVYPFLDLQQIATHVQTAASTKQTTKSTDDIALRVLAEVTSVYTERGRPEALIAAGCLALGREPCKSYAGWGIVAPTSWIPGLADYEDLNEPFEAAEWMVARISQEHGILARLGEKSLSQAKASALQVGHKLLIWPNHACIAGAGYGWYLVIDSSAGDVDVVVDVWVRWRGW